MKQLLAFTLLLLAHIGFSQTIPAKPNPPRLVNDYAHLLSQDQTDALESIVNIIAGLSKVPYRKYFLYSAIGEICQVTLYGSIGYFFGNSWDRIGAKIGHTFLIIIVVAIALIVIFWKQIRKHEDL